MTRGGGGACVAAAVLAASAIGHATGGGGPGAPVIVAVETPGARAATGFLAAGGRVVTVAHAVSEGPVTVRGEDGVARRATVVRRDSSADLAVLATPGTASPLRPPAGGLDAASPPAGRLRPAAAGARLVVRRDGGSASEPAVVLRRIDARVRAGDGQLLARRPALELRVEVRAGDSGAPLVTLDGRVAGVLFAASNRRPGIAYAVDAAALADLLR